MKNQWFFSENENTKLSIIWKKNWEPLILEEIFINIFVRKQAHSQKFSHLKIKYKWRICYKNNVYIYQCFRNIIIASINHTDHKIRISNWMMLCWNLVLIHFLLHTLTCKQYVQINILKEIFTEWNVSRKKGTLNGFEGLLGFFFDRFYSTTDLCHKAYNEIHMKINDNDKIKQHGFQWIIYKMLVNF